MAKVLPFCGIHYNQILIGNWSSVICPPYDIIDPQQQQELYRKSDYNFIRLEFGRELPQDTADDNRYTRAADTMEEWLDRGVLEVDTVPALYIHDHHFSHQGRPYYRRGLTARVRIEEWDKMVIRPHESIIGEAKGDRLSLLWSLMANTSAILAMYDDHDGEIASVLNQQSAAEPLIRTDRVDGEEHIIWAVGDVVAVDKITACMAEQPLYIADGHHRYESALTYCRERTAYSPSMSGDESFHYVMMTLVAFSDPGLVILPPHRLVRGISRSLLKELPDKLATFFEIDTLPLNTAGVWEEVDRMSAGMSGIKLLLFGLDSSHLYVLKPHDSTTISRMMPYFHSDIYKGLDVSIVDHVILENLLALSSDDEKTNLGYCYERQEAVDKVLNQEYQLTLLLEPITTEVIKNIADDNDKLPRKSTYFYPKLPAGLIVNRLV